MHPTITDDDTILTPAEESEIDAIRAEGIYYDLEDLMTYLRMRDALWETPSPISRKQPAYV